jgi:Leucine-rich repeat (LRR) protein
MTHLLPFWDIVMLRYYRFLLCFLCAFPFVFHLHAQAPAWVDAHSFGAANNDKTNHVLLDAGNNALYICGQFQGANVDFDPSAGVANLTSNSGGANADIFIAKYNATTGAYIWAISVGGNTNTDAAIRMALDGAGNIYVCGTFAGTADFNPLGAPNNKVAAGTQDIFFARYNPGGLCDWVTAIGAAATASAALDITVSGIDLYVTGRFTGSINFGGGNLMSAGVDDIFIGKYAIATGAYTNAIKVGGTGLDTGEGIIADGAGNVWVTGTLNAGGAVNFNPLGAIFNRTSAGGTDVFVAKYDATLNLVGANMAWLIGGGGADGGKSLAVDASNNIYVVGEFSGAVIDFDPSAGLANRNSNGGADGFIVSYNSAGAFRWVTTIGTTVGDLLDDVAVAGGNVYVCGGAGGGPLDLDGDPAFTSSNGAGASIDAYLAWYDANTGAYKRGKRFIGAGGSEGGMAITADAGGNIYWGGFYSSAPLDMDPRAGSTQNFSNVGLSDAFVLRYNPSASESYTWNSAAGAWSLPTNWTPQRDNPCADDILIFPAGAWLANSIPFQQVGRIVVNAGADVTWQAIVSGIFILVNGDAAPFDVDIQSTGILTLGAGINEAALRVTTGSVCNVNGVLKIGSLPNPRSYIGGWGTLNVTNTGTLSTRGPNGINGLTGLQNGAVQIDVASGGVINYDVAASFGFDGKGITGFQANALKPAITQAKDIKITPTLINERVMLDNSVTLSGALSIGGPGNNIGLSVTSANVLTLSAVPSVIDATTSPKVLEVINGTVNIPVAGGLTFAGANPRLVLCSDGFTATSGVVTGNPPTYSATSQLEYNINDANRTTTDVEVPTTMNGKILINGFAGTAPLPIVTLNNSKTFTQTVTVSNGTFSLGGGGTSINNAFVVGNAAPVSSGKVNLNNLTLTLNNNTTTLNASTFIGSATSSLTLGNGNDSFTGNLTFDPGARQLNTLIVNLGSGNTVNLGSDVSVGGQLTLTQGIITGTSPINFLRVTSNLTSSVSRTNGWVAGPLERQMQANVTVDGTNYVFPIGDAVNYRPASLQNIRTGAGTPQIRMTYAATGATTFTPPVTGFASGQNWRVETVSAGFTNSAIALDNGALPPANSRVGQSGAQVGMYATINGGAIGNVVTSDPLLATPNQFYAIVIAPGVPPYLVAPAPVPTTNSNTTAFGAMTDITLSYNENMNAPTVANMFVHGSLRGYRTGATFSQPSATQLRTTLPAGKTLAPGEQVTVTVTNATSAVTGNNPRPHVYSFLARAGIGPAQFFELQRPAVGAQPRSVVSADFNNDGRLDLCVTNSGTNDLSVLLGGIGGVFGAPVTVALPGFTSPSNIVAADFNNDGNVDIAVSCSPNVCVLVGNGAGGFAAPVGYASGPGGPRYGLTARDFNGDGNVDILVGNAGAGPGNISVLPNTGAAIFGAPITSPTIPNAFSVAAGDIDNDGDIDAVAVQSFGSNGLTISVNNGVGTFNNIASLTLAAAYDVSMGDFNGDGWLDLAVSQYSAPNQVAIYLNMGYGVFPALPNSTYATGDGVSSVVVGDYNGDGALDLITSNELSNSISVLIGNNTGAFSAAANFVTGAGPRSWSAAGDFDGDGDLDFATANFGNNSVSILLNTTQPRFVCLGGCGPVTYAPNIAPQRNVNNALTASLLTWQFTEPMKSVSLVNAPEAFRVFGGMTGKRTGTWSYNSGTTTATLTPASPFRSGEQVMVSVTAAQSAIGINARPFVYQYRNRAGVGPATFYTVQTQQVLNTQTWSIVTGYFNADSYLDVAVNGIGGTIGIEVFFGNASGGFTAGGILGGGTRYCGLEVADMNGDGTLDIIGATYGNPFGIHVFTNNGAGVFAAPLTVSSGLASTQVELAIADFDADGDLDVFATSDVTTTGGYAICLNNGTGLLSVSASSTFASAGNAFGAAAGDIDNDGDIDLVYSRFGIGQAFTLINDGVGNFTAGQTLTVGTQAYPVRLADVDNDGLLDLLAVRTNAGTNNIQIFKNTAGVFPGAPTQTVAMPGTVTGKILTFDANGDGFLDIAASEGATQSVVFILNNAGTFGTPVSTVVGNSPHALATGDIDGDGDLDLFVTNSASSAFTTLINGTQPRFVCTSGCGSVTYTPNISPQRNVNNALTASLLTWQFTEPVTAATAQVPSASGGPIRIFGGMTGQRSVNLGGAWAYTAATTTASFMPSRPFLAGEEVMVSVTSAQSTFRINTRPYLYSFRARAGAGPAVFVPQAQSPFAAGASPQAVVLGDVDGDGDVDMLVAASGGLILRQNNGTGNFATMTMIPTIASPIAIALADADGDGDLDIVVANSLVTSNVSVLLNNGSGSFATAAGSPMSVGMSPRNVAWGDTDGDGDLDIAVADFSANGVFILRNNGLSVFTAGSLIPTSGGPISLRFADMDNDGDMDILAANNSGTSGLAVLQNDGLGAYTLLAGTPIATPNSPTSLTTGDVDGDGDIDAIVSANLAATATVLLNNGNGTYTVSAIFATGAQSREVQLGDMDGDGDLDLIGISANNNTVTVRLNNGLGDFTALATAAPYSVGTSPQSVAIGDVDGDGDLDIVVANSFSNSTSVLLNQGSNGLAFSLMNVTAQEGFNGSNPTVVSRTSTPFIIGSFFGQTLLFPTTATLQYSIQALSGGTAQFSIQGSSGAALTAATSLSTQATFVWNNAPVGGGSTQAIITVAPVGALGLSSTQITVTVIAAPAYPLALAMSQVSSTGTQGINAGAFNVGQLQIVNGKSFNVAFGAWNGFGALAATQATVQSFLTGSGGETLGFTITTATFTLNNRAADTLRTIAITWDSPLALSTTVTLRLSVVSGAPLQSTSVSLVLVTTPLEPQITSFSPTTGATTSVVTVQGLNLGNVTALRVGGVLVQSFTINSPTQISIIVSTGATGFITATNLAGTGQSLVPFTFVVPPSGLMLSSTQAGVGQTITVSGNNLTSAQSVFVGGLPAMFTVTMSGQLLVIIPSGAQSGVVTVQTPGGSSNSAPLAIIPSPSITSVSPATVAGGGTITITGANLTNVTSVTIGGIPVTSFMVLSSTQIVAVVSASAISAPVQVMSAGGIAFSTTSIVVALPPTVTSVSNTSPIAGTQIFIGGSGFTLGMQVTIGGVPVPLVQVNSPSEAIITMPASATNGTLSITTPFGTSTFSTVIAVTPGVIVPSGIDFTPVTGSIGTSVTIVGQGFIGVREVSFGGVPVQRFTVESSVRIVAVLSTGATGTARVITTTGSAESQRIFLYNSPLQLDSLAAVSFFLMTGGVDWANRTNWLTRQPLQSWYGLTVQGGRIISIALPNNNLNGTLTSAIVQLSVISALKTLNLSGSRLPGVLPSAIGTMRTLRTLNLSAIGLSGALPKELANLDSLEVLRLDTNNLSGSPEEILCSLGTTSSRQASALRDFRINNNQLSGVIPPCLVEFKQLEIVHLQNNRFTGVIPERIVELERLRELLLANNSLSGALPSSFNRTLTGKTTAAQTSIFSTLERLDLGGNGFTGALPQGIAQFAALKELRLNDNTFAGALPPTLTSLTKLEVLDASRNRFTGALPEEIGSMRRLRQVSFVSNNLSGSVPESLGECDLLERLELDSNALEGVLPQALGTWQKLRLLGLSQNRFTSLPTLSGALVPLETLRLQSNRFTFESIEGNTKARIFTYSPQDSIGTAQNLAFQPQSRIELNITVGGNANRYQWFKNGVAFGSPSSSGFFVISEKASDAESGVYECRITNPLAPALTLYSRPWQIRVDSSTQAPVQTDAVQQPTLIFPTNNARFVSYSPSLRWLRGEGAVQYQVQALRVSLPQRSLTPQALA